MPGPGANPVGPAAEIAVSVVRWFDGPIDLVRFVAFDESALVTYQRLIGERGDSAAPED